MLKLSFPVLLTIFGKCNAYTILVGKPCRRWVNSIKTGVKEIVCDDADWIHVTQDRVERWAVVSTVMNQVS